MWKLRAVPLTSSGEKSEQRVKTYTSRHSKCFVDDRLDWAVEIDVQQTSVFNLILSPTLHFLKLKKSLGRHPENNKINSFFLPNIDYTVS